MTGVSPLRGRLLVATPVIRDPNFFRTVVLVVEHGDQGSLGVILNRPTGLDLGEVLPAWQDLGARPGVVFDGGPVRPAAGVCLGTSARAPAGGWEPVFGPVGVVDINQPRERLAPPVDRVRLFSGYAGWGPGQLDGELAVNAWVVVDAETGDVLTDEPEELWRRVLRRQRGHLAMMANYPLDPTAN